MIIDRPGSRVYSSTGLDAIACAYHLRVPDQFRLANRTCVGQRTVATGRITLLLPSEEYAD